MDEIDAVGRHRGAGLGGGHDEREQTLNQLLVEMDGFELKDNIILIAATNRPDILDPALLRPGRFDRQIVVDRPDRNGRRKILEVHAKGKPLAPEIDLDTLAAGTPGFTGADLANLINEAALLAARRGKKMIEQDELEEGIMRVIAGPEKKTRLLSEKERKITAYHEMGHALVGHYLEDTDEVHKISIMSAAARRSATRSRCRREDRYLTTKSALMDQLAMTLGGRAAEELVFHEVTTGAANDLEKVTLDREADDHALRDEREARPARARPQPRHAVPRPRHGRRARLLRGDRARDRRRDPPRDRGGARRRRPRVLREHMDELHRLSAILIERETIDKDQFERLLAGEAEESVFPEDVPEPAIEEPEAEPKPKLKPQPRPIPGAAMQPAAGSGDQLARAPCSFRTGSSRPAGSRRTLFRLEPLGPEHNERDYEAWSSSIEHILASPGYGAGSRWPRPMSLEENLADLERHARDFADRDGLHVLGARSGRRRDRLRLRLSGRATTRTMLASSPGCGRPAPSSMRRCGRPSPVGSRAPGRSSGRSTSRCSAELDCHCEVAPSEQRRRQHRDGRERAEQVEREAARRAPRRRGRGAPPATTNAAAPPSATSAARRRPSPASPGARHALVERPVRELGGDEQAAAITGAETSSGASSMASSTAYVPSDERDGRGDERRPAEDDRGDEGDERDDRDARPGLLEGAVSARERHGGDREQADDAADARSTMRVRQPCVAPECPHLLERGLEVSVAPGGDADATALEARAQHLTFEQPEPIRDALDRGSTRLDQPDGVDLDDRDVEAASAEVLERGENRWSTSGVSASTSAWAGGCEPGSR